MSFQAYLDNIEEKTGKTPNDFIAMAQEKGFDNPKTKAGDIVAWLKEDYGLGRGHAMAIVYVVVAKRSYFSRISIGRPYRHPQDAPPLMQAEMLDWARASGAGLVEWGPQVQPGDVVQVDWDGVLRDVPKAILLTQAINHATEHRAQVMAILTQLGIEPPELSGWEYFAALLQPAGSA